MVQAVGITGRGLFHPLKHLFIAVYYYTFLVFNNTVVSARIAFLVFVSNKKDFQNQTLLYSKSCVNCWSFSPYIIYDQKTQEISL